ncbi:MAG: carbohydrate binding family 9 domain-containing protein, partial [Ignavibacteriales bacterium]|nr:carbohydrate binding family 9 domain-containing protein [Ignavibacteriales bacterium]
MKKAFIPVVILLTITSVVYSHKDTLSVRAFKLSNTVTLDGILDEAIWQNPAVERFTQKDPNEGEPSSERTKVWVAYDETYIYVAARLYDSNPSQIDATVARRDTYMPSDWFAFEIDSYKDKKTGYFFAVNAGGTIADGIYFNDSWDDGSWDGIWDAKTNIDGEGWTLEMRIPFSQIRFNQSENMIWGVNFERHIKKNNEKSYFVMVPKTESGYVSHFADLVGLEGVKPKQRFEFLPYVVQRAQYLVHDPNDPFYKGNQYRTSIGADFKVGIGSNFNLDATILPDFGQVEVDPAQLNLSAFETYYQEKRPFFIEGSSILTMFGYGGANNNWGFNFGNPNLFYSRRIGRTPRGYIDNCDYANYPTETRILGAAKLTGKVDDSWEMGVLSTMTERTYAELDISGERKNQEVEPFTHYGVFRSKKEFNDGRQALGMIFTSVNRDLSNDALKSQYSSGAYTLGLDGWTFLDEEKEYVITASVIGSHTTGTKEYMWKLQKAPYRYFQRPDATFMPFDSNRTSLEGLYSRIVLNKQKGNFYVNAALGISTPGFEYNDLGYQWFADRIAGHVVLGYRWFEPDGLFRYKSLYTAYNRQIDFEGNLLRNGFFLMSSAQFENYYSVD